MVLASLLRLTGKFSIVQEHETIISESNEFPSIKDSKVFSEAVATMIDNVVSIHQDFYNDPAAFFNTILYATIAIILLIKAIQNLLTANHIKKTSSLDDEHNESVRPKLVERIQRRFLPVFWLLRTAFWMSGPYFYAVYASKVVDGQPATPLLISQIFLVGFASIALFGPAMGRLMTLHGTKRGTIAASVIYGLGALSTRSSSISILFFGRALGGIGTSLIGSAPESWLVNAMQQTGEDINGKWLKETFAWAFSMDSIVAIAAGQLSSWAAGKRGPTGPFEVSPCFLAIAAIITLFFWTENNRMDKESDNDNKVDFRSKSETSNANRNITQGGKRRSVQFKKPTTQDAINVMMSDQRILMVGAIQSLFEGSMYIFVMLWPPAMDAAVKAYFVAQNDNNNIDSTDSGSINTPYGTVFSCFMGCCMLGTILFGEMSKLSISTEKSTITMLTIASLSLAGSAATISGALDGYYSGIDNDNTAAFFHLINLIVTFFIFEACVGFYFPSIGTLRGRFLPGSHRSVLMTLFGVPLNAMVFTVFLFIHKIGTTGSMVIASVALGIAAICGIRLNMLHEEELRKDAKRNWKTFKNSMKARFVLNKLKSAVSASMNDDNSDSALPLDQMHDSYQMIGSMSI